MAEVQIPTLRGKNLAASFVNPVDNEGVAVLFVHGFLSDRHDWGWFDVFAKTYRGMGYATLQMDCSGCGLSDDAAITLENITDDIRAASLWLREQGFHDQIIQAEGLGAQAALLAAPDNVSTMILTSPVCGAVDIEWDQIFTDEQLSELEASGTMYIPDDTDSNRENFAISKQTLSDMSLMSAQRLCQDMNKPVLFLFSAQDQDNGFVQMLQDGLQYFQGDVRIEVLPNSDFTAGPDADSATTEALVEHCRTWLRTYHPLKGKGAAG